ncbi:hypothetical protein [Microbacterium sp.]|uniref:hypothetical protein n=1 Tax=Microbacterium sp. TaxID=51671 RepID=UPI0035ADD483
MSFAVAFNDQPPVHYEVDPSDAVDPHLDVHLEAEAPHHQSNKRLWAGFAPAIEQRSQGLVPPGQPPEDCCDPRFVEQTDVPDGVERRKRGARRLAATGLGDRFHEVGREPAAGRGRRAKMAHRAGVPGLNPGGGPVHLDVGDRPLQDEHTEHSQERHAVKAAPRACCSDQVRRTVAAHERAFPQPD